MSNPYSSVTIQNYNISPPSDDGSAIATNQLEWSKHKTKLGDPLKTAIESINTNAIAAFGKRFGTEVSEHSSNYQIVPGDQGKYLVGTSGFTFTLPAASDAGEGFPLLIVNSGTANVTIDGNASELINGETSLVLYPTGFAILTCDGAEWHGFVDPGIRAGSFNPTPTGVTSPSGAMSFSIRRNKATLAVTTLVGGVSSSTAFTVTGLPAYLTPNFVQVHPTFVANGAVTPANRPAIVSISTGGVMTFSMGDPFSTTGFTNDGNPKGLTVGWMLTYPLWLTLP